MKTSDFDYELPPQLIAQTPVEPRDHSRLMLLHRAKRTIEHYHFFDIVDLLQPGDVLVFNDSRVIPARLWGHKVDGGKIELLLLRRLEEGVWETLAKPARRVRAGDKIEVMPAGEELNMSGTPFSTQGEVLKEGEGGLRTIAFLEEKVLEELGEVPLPPYIHTPISNPERYQTVYARVKGSVAAPTAGLHFTPQLLDLLNKRGVELAFVTLHVGLDSFRPVRGEEPHQHPMHKEYGELDEETARRLALARKEGRRIICVGTTAVRLLEEAALAGEDYGLKPFRGWVGIFLLPGHSFRMVDALITNFHLPRSTLLMLVSAFAGSELIKQAYQEAIKLNYRFYSFGDCMLIL